MFEVREFDSDISFIRNYLTKKLSTSWICTFSRRKGRNGKLPIKSWENIRDQLVFSRVNGGFPYMVVRTATISEAASCI